MRIPASSLPPGDTHPETPTPTGTHENRGLPQGRPALSPFATTSHSHTHVLTHILRGNHKPSSQSDPPPGSTQLVESSLLLTWTSEWLAQEEAAAGTGDGCVAGVELDRPFCRHIAPVTCSPRQRARATLSSSRQSQPGAKKQVRKAYSDGHSSGRREEENKGWKGCRGLPVGRTRAFLGLIDL